jgi:7-carboxy-7-deazaguanine synthase
MESPLKTAQTPSAPAAAAALLVSELYRSIQGESTYAGRPCTFVRLTGCPLRCAWCDSAYAFQGGERLALADVMARVRALGVNLVEVTGGEPLAQPGCLPLLRALCDEGFEVLLETSGALDVAPVDPRVVKIVDIKCPGSGEVEANRWENLGALGPRDELKFVLSDRADYAWAREILSSSKFQVSSFKLDAGDSKPESRKPAPRTQNLELGTWNLELPRRPIHFSPVHGQLDPAHLASWILEDGLDVRVQIQLHKYLWPNQTRGV